MSQNITLGLIEPVGIFFEDLTILIDQLILETN